MSAIFLLPVCLTYWPRKYTTRASPHVDNSHQVLSWYDHPLPSYSVFVCWHVTWPGDLDLWPFDLEQLSYMAGHVTTLPPSLKTLRPFVHELRIITVPIDYHRKCVRGHCACAESRDPWVGGQKRLHFGYPRPRFAYSLCNFRASTMKVIKVVCENHALPCIKRRMSFCTCAKSRDLLKLSYVSYCSPSRRRRFSVLDFKSWAYSRIYGHFQQHLYCACAETVIYELPV